MSISSLTGYGQMGNNQQNKLYLVNVTAHSVGQGDTDFNFYSSQELNTIADLSSYIKNNGILVGSYYRIYCFGCRVTSEYIPILSMYLEVAANSHIILAKGYLTNGTAYNVSMDTNYSSNYIKCVEV